MLRRTGRAACAGRAGIVQVGQALMRPLRMWLGSGRSWSKSLDEPKSNVCRRICRIQEEYCVYGTCSTNDCRRTYDPSD